MNLLRLLGKGLAWALILTAVTIVTGLITMWLASEKDKVRLPRVIGIDSTTALELLREQGLQPKVSGREYSEAVPKGAVLSQRPASGTWVRKDGEIRLVVSDGSDAVALPDLSGLPLPQVRQLLQQSGLTLGRVAQVHSSQYPKGEVIAQDPEAGARVRRGNPIAVLLSLGPLDETSSFRIPPISYRDFIVKVGTLAKKPSRAKPNSPLVLVGAGDIASCAGEGDEATASLLDTIDGTVFTLGDNVYPSGTPTEFAACYDPSWGRHKSRTRPAPGNHDYRTRGAFGYFDYFGKAAGDSDKGYYSYDLGAWHIIVLNSNCSEIGGCGPGSPQERWLRADLAAHPATCTLAYWHHPRFSSGRHGSEVAFEPFWRALYAHGAEIVLAGHDHAYERFAPQTPDGRPDPDRGIRQFVVGTGGDRLRKFNGPAIANSEARNDGTHGILKLTLHPANYEWEFAPIAGGTFTDSGTGRCH